MTSIVFLVLINYLILNERTQINNNNNNNNYNNNNNFESNEQLVEEINILFPSRSITKAVNNFIYYEYYFFS